MANCDMTDAGQAALPGGKSSLTFFSNLIWHIHLSKELLCVLRTTIDIVL